MRGENRNNKGFTLIEAVVSMMILAIVVLSIIGGFNIITNANFKAKKIQGANTLYSDINETLKEASNYSEAEYIIDNELNGKEFSVGAMKFTVEASIDPAGGEGYSSGTPAVLTDNVKVGTFDYIYYYRGHYYYGGYSSNIDYYYSPSLDKYYYMGKKVSGGSIVPDSNPHYFTKDNYGSYNYYYTDVEGYIMRVKLPDAAPTPTPVPGKGAIVKSYDNFVYQLNSEDYAKFPVFDSTVRSFKMDYTEYDAIENEYTEEDIDLIKRQNTYSVNLIPPARTSRILAEINPKAGDKGRVIGKQVYYKFKKIWETDPVTKKTVVKYIIATMLTYNKGYYQYISDNYYGYDFAGTRCYINGMAYSTTNIPWYRNFYRVFGTGISDKYSVAGTLGGVSGSNSITQADLPCSGSITDMPMVYPKELLYIGGMVNTLNNTLPEYVIASGEADGFDPEYGPTSSEARAQLDAMDSVYLFYTPYIEPNADGSAGEMKATDEKYLNLGLWQDDSWDYFTQKNLYLLVSGKDATETSVDSTGNGYLAKYWRWESNTEEQNAKMFFGNEKIKTNVKFYFSDAGASSGENYSRYTGVNYAAGNKYNKDFSIVAQESVADDGKPDKAAKVNVKLKYGNDQILEKDWYLYFK